MRDLLERMKAEHHNYSHCYEGDKAREIRFEIEKFADHIRLAYGSRDPRAKHIIDEARPYFPVLGDR